MNKRIKLKEILIILFLIISFFLSISAIAIANYRAAYVLKYDNNSFLWMGCSRFGNICNNTNRMEYI